MSLKETQTLLARLLTDASLRADFAADPRAAARRVGVTEPAATLLSAIDRDALADFAAGLLGKRALDARKVLPLTAAALGPAFDRRLIAALDGPLPPGRHRADAARLARDLVDRPDPARPWLGDLARYELAFVEASRPRAALILRLYRWPPARLAEAARRGAAMEARRRLSLGVWLRAPGGRLLHWRL